VAAELDSVVLAADSIRFDATSGTGKLGATVRGNIHAPNGSIQK
jgi:hypothetical protein